MSISIIVALSKNDCIGINGKLPWDIPEDLRHFKKITKGHAVIMGRKTWESLPQKFRPLPNRTNIVITRQKNYQLPEKVLCFQSLRDAVIAFPHAFVIGGAELYALALPLTETLYITEIETHIENCTTFFPKIDMTVWRETERENHKNFSFVIYKKTYVHHG